MPDPFLIDLTRLTSRLGGRTLTGIDRVELAWLRHLILQAKPVFGLIRLRHSLYLADENAVAAVAGMFSDGRSHDHFPALAPIWPTQSRNRFGLMRTLASGLTKLGQGRANITEMLAKQTLYMNFGHSNLSDDTFELVRQLPDVIIATLIHDAIPLDHPDLQSPKMAGQFQGRLDCAGRHSDWMIYSSQTTKSAVEKHITAPASNTVVAPFGPGLEPNAVSHQSNDPYFVAISTIEPRKNIEFLLNLWANLIQNPPDAGVPTLKIIGRRGWADQKLFSEIDRMVQTGHVQEHNDLPDSAVSKMLGASRGLVFPTLSEGFGLPALDAAAHGVPAICAPLGVFREILGQIPVYVDPADVYRWRETVIELADDKKQKAERDRVRTLITENGLPNWADHFNTVLTAIG